MWYLTTHIYCTKHIANKSKKCKDWEADISEDWGGRKGEFFTVYVSSVFFGSLAQGLETYTYEFLRVAHRLVFKLEPSATREWTEATCIRWQEQLY